MFTGRGGAEMQPYQGSGRQMPAEISRYRIARLVPFPLRLPFRALCLVTCLEKSTYTCDRVPDRSIMRDYARKFGRMKILDRLLRELAGGGGERHNARSQRLRTSVRGLSRERSPVKFFALRRFDVANSPGFRTTRLVYELISRG